MRLGVTSGDDAHGNTHVRLEKQVTSKRRRSICYLCGTPGADSKDHVPPKSLLPPPSDACPRLTVRAHAKCNAGHSADEEYVRDLIVPEAIQFGFKDAEVAYERVWRAWSRDGGWTRYQAFLKDYQVIQVRTAAGLYAGNALGIIPDHDRLRRVGTKIVRGIIFHDSGAVIEDEGVALAPLPARELPAIKERDAQESYWRALSSPVCLHTVCGSSCALRRIYIGRPTGDGILLEAHFAIVIWTVAFVASAAIPLASVTKKGFAFAIDETSGEWIREPASGDKSTGSE
jgi:hypothetical protein